MAATDSAQTIGKRDGPEARGRPRRRRSPTDVLRWVVVVLLIAFLAGVASGLIHVDTRPPKARLSPLPTSPPANGWGARSSYVGRYRMTQGSLEGGIAGASEIKLKEGELTLFPREVQRGAPLVPSGLVQLRVPTRQGPVLVNLYVSELRSFGRTRHAEIKGSAPTGPVLGSFAGVSPQPGRLSGVAMVKGLGTIRANFVRFSTRTEQ